MNKFRYISGLVLLLCGLTVSAQRYERVVKDNFWNSSRNVSGIRQDSVSRSYAEAYGKYETGGFRDTWQAEKGWSTGAATASIRHLERLSLKGSFSFEQTEGYGMCGSMFIDPGFYPVNMLEFTPGRKSLQTYALDGGFSYDLTPRWRIGAAMDFESANMAKKKDLRHTNWKLDMTLAPGFTYHSGNFAIGGSYIFRKTSESIKAEQVGTSESSYYAFLDKGLMYGVYSVWSGSGRHLSEAGVNGFPVKDFSNGVALQMQYNGFFAEAEYLRTNGTIGEKEYIWFRFPGNEIGVVLGYRKDGEQFRHYARIDLGWKGLGLDESILEKVSENGVTSVLNHGSNRILTQETISLSPEYELVGKKFEILVGADIRWKNGLSSQMYPFVFTQSLMNWKAGAEALVHLNRFDLRAGLAFGDGSVKESSDKVTQDSGVQTEPFRLEEWYSRQMEFLTATRSEASLSLRYNFRKGIYLQAEGFWTHGFSLPQTTDSNRLTTVLRLGLSF